jgi:hypothetical protein
MVTTVRIGCTDVTSGVSRCTVSRLSLLRDARGRAHVALQHAVRGEDGVGEARVDDQSVDEATAKCGEYARRLF